MMTQEQEGLMMASFQGDTTGAIARRLDRPVHQIEYAIRTRNIQPDGQAGHYRLFGEAAVERIQAALQEMDARRGGASCKP